MNTWKILLSFFFLTSFVSSLKGEDWKVSATNKLEFIHSQLKLLHGDFAYEYPEQLLTAFYLPSDAKVLELGSNLGNNSCVIGYILNDSSNLVTMETRTEAIRYLTENRDINSLKFHIVEGALSKVPLIQKGWITQPSNEDIDGFFRVNTFSFNELQEQYDIIFDTLVVDAEGALYQILLDDPEILNNIKLIIIENDFKNAEQCLYTLNLFRENGFLLIHNEGKHHWLDNAFNQVWQK